jgi:hypothetical protein
VRPKQRRLGRSFGEDCRTTLVVHRHGLYASMLHARTTLVREFRSRRPWLAAQGGEKAAPNSAARSSPPSAAWCCCPIDHSIWASFSIKRMTDEKSPSSTPVASCAV